MMRPGGWNCGSVASSGFAVRDWESGWWGDVDAQPRSASELTVAANFAELRVKHPIKLIQNLNESLSAVQHRAIVNGVLLFVAFAAAPAEKFPK